MVDVILAKSLAHPGEDSRYEVSISDTVLRNEGRLGKNRYDK
jgi:hypothetical protein